jgi:hypothetical protein
MARPHTPLPGSLVGRAFTTSEARGLGVGEGRLRARDLQRPFHGVRVRADADADLDLEQRCRAKLATMRPGQVFSHVTACRLMGITVPRRLHSDDLDVAAFKPHAIPRGRGVAGHRLTAGLTQSGTVSHLPVVAAEDAWCQLASYASLRELVVAGDSLVRRKRPISDIDRMTAAAGRYAGRRHHRRLAEALELVRPRTDSPQETLLRLDVLAYGLPEPEVNLPVHGTAGRIIALGDLGYRRRRVLLEYDGEQHRTDDRQFVRDVDRLDDLAHAGWRVIRFTKQHVGVARAERLERVRQELCERGWRPGLPA